jgi:hypothetical protein
VIQEVVLYVYNMYNSVVYLVSALHPCEGGGGSLVEQFCMNATIFESHLLRYIFKNENISFLGSLKSNGV